MAKRRRRQAKPQARPSGREWWEQQQASAKRAAESPFFRDLQEHNRLPDSPLGRGMVEDARQLREWQERNLRAHDVQPDAMAPSAKRRRRGGGRKKSLTDDEIVQLQAAYRAIRQDKPTLKQSSIFDEWRAQLDRHVGDSTFRRLVIKPISPK
jgi:hypothetical protein